MSIPLKQNTKHISAKSWLDLSLSFGQNLECNKNIALFCEELRKCMDLPFVSFWTMDGMAYTIKATKPNIELIQLADQYLGRSKSKITNKRSGLHKKIAKLSRFKELSFHIFKIGAEGLLVLGTKIEIKNADLMVLKSIIKKFARTLEACSKSKELKNSTYQLDKIISDREKHYEEVFNNFNLGYFKVEDGLIKFANAKFYKMLGYKKAEIIGINPNDLIHQDDLGLIDEYFKKLKSKSIPFMELDIRMVTKKGDLKYVQTIINSTKHADGKTSSEVSVIDQTKSKLQEQEIRQREAIVEAIIEASPDDILMTDLEGKVLHLNTAAKKNLEHYFGLKVTKGSIGLRKSKNKQLQELDKLMIKALKGENVDHEYIHDEKNELFHVSSKIRQVKDSAGKVIGCVFITRDISEFVRKESFLNSMIASTNQHILALDQNLNISLINDSCKKYLVKRLNLTKESGQNLSDVIPKKHKEYFNNIFNSVLNGESFSLNYEANLGEINIIDHFELNFSPIKNIKGEINGILLVANNTNDLQQKQKELEKREATLQAVLNGSPDGIYAIDKDFKIICVNKKAIWDFKKYLNLDIQENSDLSKLVDPETLDRWNQAYFARVLNNEEVTYTGKVPSGEQHYIENKYGHVKAKNGESIGVIEISRDITDLVLKEKVIETKEQELRAIIDHTPMGITRVDTNNVISFVSNRTAQIFGAKKKDVLNHNLLDFIHEDDKNNLKSKLIELIKGKDEVIGIFRAIHKTKDTLFIEGVASVKRDKDGNPMEYLLAFNDITERVKAENLVKESEEKYKNLVESSPSGLAQIDKDGKFIFVSEKGAEILGGSVKDIQNLNFRDFIYPKFVEGIEKDLDILATGQTSLDFRIKGENLRKETMYLNGVARKITNSKNDNLILFIFNDVTTRIIAEKALKRTRQKYSTMYENMNECIFVYNKKENKITEANKATIKLLGLSKKQIIGKTVLDFVPKFSLHQEGINQHELIEQFLTSEKEKTHSQRLVFESKNNKASILDVNILPTQEKGEEVFFIGHDITDEILTYSELEKKSAELVEKNAIYQALVDHSFEGVDIVEIFPNEKDNKAPKVILRNDKMANYTGSKTEPIISKKDILSKSPTYQNNKIKSSDAFNNFVNDVDMKNNKLGEWKLLVGNEIRDFQIGVNLVNVQNKQLLIRQLKDITEFKYQTNIIKDQFNELTVKNEELTKYINSNLQLENFAYIASHDLKAPLRTVSSFAYLLKQKAYELLDDKSKSYLDIVVRSSKNMQQLIDDLLAFSRVNTQKKSFRKLKIQAILDRILLELNSSIQESNSKIILNVEPKELVADESMLYQIFQNLIGNAIKFTKEDVQPTIEVNCSEDETHYLFEVKDNGIGINPDSSDKIFGIFEKLHSNDRFDGTGLGLSICKKIAEIHNGKIWVESEIGQGSSFFFSIHKELKTR